MTLDALQASLGILHAKHYMSVLTGGVAVMAGSKGGWI
jgi:hypothetical protein